MLADFTINVHDVRKPLAVQVKVHDNVAALRSASTKHVRRDDPKAQPDFSDTLGICHRFHKISTPLCAIVRLAPPNIGAGIVAHEMTHAAVWIWEIEHKFSKKILLTCENDEWFAWMLGELVRHTHSKLWEKGVYSR